MSRISRRQLIASGALAAGALAGSPRLLVTARLPGGRRLRAVRRARVVG